MRPLTLGVFLLTCIEATNCAPAQHPGGVNASRAMPLFTAIPAETSGVTKTYPLIADHPRAYLYSSGFACGGVAIGDVNRDARPDLFFTCGPESNRLYLQTDKPFVFRDATEEAGLSGRTPKGDVPWSAGAAMVDLNRDHHLDIYVCNYDSPNQLFINDGMGRFTERARDHGLDIVDASLFPAFMDIDGSGDLALYLVTNRYERPGGRPRQPPVVVVDGAPRVKPEFQKYYGLKRVGPTSYNIDFVGRPDRLLMVIPPLPPGEGRGEGNSPTTTAPSPNPLPKGEGLNIGRGRRYRDVSRESGVGTDTGHGLSATWLDYNDDGRPDLYVCNDFTDPDCLYRNEGKGPDGIVRFTNVIADVVPLTTWSSMGADAADVNNDGLIDLMTGDMASRTHFDAMLNAGDISQRLDTLLHSWPRQAMRNMLYLNTGAGHFLETAYLSGVAQTDWTWAIKLADFDNDGRVDLFVTNGSSRNFTDADMPFSTEMYIGNTDWDLLRRQPPRKERNLAFRNVDGLRFEDVSRAWGLDHLGMSYGAAYGDLDSDGDLDLVVCNLGETVSIYRNDVTPANHWLQVRLRGTASHTQGWGARVRVKTASGWRMRQMNPATGFNSCNAPLVHFGLGDEMVIEAVEVRWPSDRLQRVDAPAANQILTLTEPATNDSVVRGSPDPARIGSAAPHFAPTSNIGLDFRHEERPFDDYAREPLLAGKLSQLGPGIAVGDANGDERDDVYIGGAAGQPGALFVANAQGHFTRVDGPWQDDSQCEDMGALWFDADGDGRLDLYVVSGGVEGSPGDAVFEDRLYVNSSARGGPPSFVKAPPQSLPDTREAGFAACAADFDRDGDLDLFVGSRSIPGSYPQTPRSLLLRNDSTPGKPKFVNVTDQRAPALAQAGLVTGAVWSDADADGYPDLFIACEWGPIKVFRNRQGNLVDETEAAGVAALRGWWNGIAAGDFNSDARIDYLVTNVGLNTKYGEATRSNPAILFAGDLSKTGGFELAEAKVEREGVVPVRSRSVISNAIPQLWHKFPTYRAYAAARLTDIFDAQALRNSLRLVATEFRTGLLINRSTPEKLSFEWQPLADIAQISPGFGVAVADFSGDGRTDAVIAQNLFTREPETGLWRGGLGQLLCGTADGKLESIPPNESGVVVPGDAKGAATIDIDGDARPDALIAQNNDALITLRNQSPGPWLALRLIGANGTAAIGARATIHFDDGSSFTGELCAGSGYLSQSAPEIYIGLNGRRPQRAEITWPSGNRQTLRLTGKSGRITLKAPN